MSLELKSDSHGSKPCSQTSGGLLGWCLAASASDRRLWAVRLLEAVFLCVCLAVTRTEPVLRREVQIISLYPLVACLPQTPMSRCIYFFSGKSDFIVLLWGTLPSLLIRSDTQPVSVVQSDVGTGCLPLSGASGSGRAWLTRRALSFCVLQFQFWTHGLWNNFSLKKLR